MPVGNSPLTSSPLQFIKGVVARGLILLMLAMMHRYTGMNFLKPEVKPVYRIFSPNYGGPGLRVAIRFLGELHA